MSFVAHNRLNISLAFAFVLLVPLFAQAQTIDQALRQYRMGDYDEAAKMFYTIFITDTNPDYRDQAEIYLADCMYKMELYIPALYYYSDLFKVGLSNRYYLNAIEGMLNVRKKLHDHYIVPSMLNKYYSPEGYGRLDVALINEINYLIGVMSYNQGKLEEAASLFRSIPPEADRYYIQARYLLSIIAVKRGDPEGAINILIGLQAAITPDTEEPARYRIWQLATLGLARIHYSLGNFDVCIDFYKEIPRFDSMWFDALYEMAWAYFQQEDYGHALGTIQSVMSPYFNKRYYPESYVVMATTYFANCQWDRARRSLEKFNKQYKPMLTELKKYLNTPRQLGNYYDDIVQNGNGHYAETIARQVRRVQWFLDLHHLLDHMDWEEDAVNEESEWTNSQLASDLEAIIAMYRTKVKPEVGKYVRKNLTYQKEILSDFIDQGSIIEFEVADAEKRWLEAGKNIIKGKRARLPRPEIPSDQWQHWNFSREYWVDELGYYVHSIKSECYASLR